MNSLKNLISKYGEPDALIDHWSNESKKMAIWGFDEIFTYNTDGCYLNEKKIIGDPLTVCNNILNKWNQELSLAYAIGYISYDMKNYLFPHLKLKKIEDQTLMWFGKPKLIKEYNIDDELILDYEDNQSLTLIKEIPDIAESKESPTTQSLASISNSFTYKSGKSPKINKQSWSCHTFKNKLSLTNATIIQFEHRN